MIIIATIATLFHSIKTLNMKTSYIHRMTILALLFAFTLPASARIFPKKNATEKVLTEMETVRMQELLQRLQYIKGMDKSALNSMEKKAMRKEVKNINKEMKTLSGGVYISVAAAIIIILLLILLL
jgi:hypothetical protein